MNLTPWQSTALALFGFAAGLVLHLRWHPLRRHLSDAWDCLRLRPALILWTAGAMLLARVYGETPHAPYSMAQLTDWQEMLLPLARDALAHLAALPAEIRRINEVRRWHQGRASTLASMGTRVNWTLGRIHK